MAVDAALHAARRLSFGPTPDLVAEIRKVGVAGWVETQLKPEAITDLETDLTVAGYVYPALPPVALLLGDQDYTKAMESQRSVATVRQLMSNRQLFEVMAAFWADHFSIYGRHQIAYRWRAWDDREVARKFALATFPELLTASAHSPAMLSYLDNTISVGKNPNENYAREVMELHTLGAYGGYTEDDVHNAALALTGWGIDPNYATFQFDPGKHYVGRLRVMGWTHANKAGDGEAVGQSLLDYLAHHPSTARHLATKLCRRFVADSPPGGLTGRVAKTLQGSGMSIPAAIRTITSSSEFKTTIGTKYRRPAEWMIASLRAVGSKPNLNPFPADRHPVVNILQSLGQQPFGWVPPNGFPDIATKWESTAQTLNRWNFAQAIANGSVGDMGGYDPATLLGSPAPTTAGELVERMYVRIVGQKPTPDEKAGLLEIVGRLDGAGVNQTVITASLRPLVAMILSTPTMQVR